MDNSSSKDNSVTSVDASGGAGDGAGDVQPSDFPSYFLGQKVITRFCYSRKNSTMGNSSKDDPATSVDAYGGAGDGAGDVQPSDNSFKDDSDTSGDVSDGAGDASDGDASDGDASDGDASDVDASDVDASDVDASDVDASDVDATVGDASDGAGEVQPSNTPTYSEGEIVIAQFQSYEAKVLKAEIRDGELKYLIHYPGWNKKWDEWASEYRLMKYTEENARKYLAQDKKASAEKNAKSGRSRKGKAKSSMVSKGKKRKHDSRS